MRELRYLAHTDHPHDIEAGFLHDAMTGGPDGFGLGLACIKGNLLEEPEENIGPPSAFLLLRGAEGFGLCHIFSESHQSFRHHQGGRDDWREVSRGGV